MLFSIVFVSYAVEVIVDCLARYFTVILVIRRYVLTGGRSFVDTGVGFIYSLNICLLYAIWSVMLHVYRCIVFPCKCLNWRIVLRHNIGEIF